MNNKSSDGVSIKVATQRQLDSYDQASLELNSFLTPKIFDSKDLNSRVFFALFDGTGNDAINDPKHATNIGLIARQVIQANSTNKSIGYYYKEGVGTQGGIAGVIDAATGSSYHARIEDMYDKFDIQSAKWIEENPDAKISVISIGFSRGAEQAAGFSRVVHDRGIQDPKSRIEEPFGDGTHAVNTYSKSPIRKPGTIPQAVGLFDPVASGEPSQNDRRLPPSVISGLQILAANEYRALFPSSNIIKQGCSLDGRFLGLKTAGCHSDIGGGYERNGLAHRNFNLMSKYINYVLGEHLVKVLEVPSDPMKSVIHDSSQHKWFYTSLTTRGTDSRIGVNGIHHFEHADPLLKHDFYKNTYRNAAEREKIFTYIEIGEKASEHEIKLAKLKLDAGMNSNVRLPETNTVYSGPIIQISETHIIQRTGNNCAVAHDVSKLSNGNEIKKQITNGWADGKEIDILYDDNTGTVTMLQLNKLNSVPFPIINEKPHFELHLSTSLFPELSDKIFTKSRSQLSQQSMSAILPVMIEELKMKVERIFKP